jgi:hypothetical protein
MEEVLEFISDVKYGCEVFFNSLKFPLLKSKITFLDSRGIKYRCFKLASGKTQIVINEKIIPRYFTGVNKVNDMFTFITLDERVIPSKIWITLDSLGHILQVLMNAYHMNARPLSKTANLNSQIDMWEFCCDHLKDKTIHEVFPELFMSLRVWRGLDLQTQCDKNLYSMVPSQEYDLYIPLIETRKKFIKNILGRRKDIPILHF